MLPSLAALPVLATESGIPYTSPLAKIAVPIGILIFLGTPYMLLRSNLGTKRAYLVLFTSFFGFMVILSLFWAFGAPGTPPNTGPTNLPGTVADEYQPIWVPFAEDSNVAAQGPYAELVDNPDAFGEPPEGQQEIVATGVGDIKNFFSAAEADSGYAPRIQQTWDVAEQGYAVASNGLPVVRAVYQATFQPTPSTPLPDGVEQGALDPDGATFTAYAFFDAGNPLFPSAVFIGLSLVLFVIHALLLHRDETAERREDTEVVVTDQREPVRV